MGARHDLQDVDLFSVAMTHAYVDDNHRFRPRTWLAERVDRHLRDPGCRFVLLTAAPGAGKSAFMAGLAGQHAEWPRYFIRESQSSQFDDPQAQSFLLKVGLQLAARFPDLFSDDAVKVAVEQRPGSVETAVAVDVGRLIASPFHQFVIDIRQQVGHALRAEMLEIGIQPSICLAVLATGWPDEYDRRPMWRRAADESVGHPDPQDLDAALTRSPPDVRRYAVDLMADRIESLQAELQFFVSRTMPVLPRHATDEQMMRLAGLAHHLTDVHEWASVAAPLLERARPETREALTVAARYEGGRAGTGADRITDLVAARFAPEPVRRDVIGTTTTAIQQGHGWLVEYLTPLLIRQPVDHAYRQLSDIFEERSAHGRDALLKTMTALAPAIGHVAGPRGTADVLDAVRRVRDWWP